jgi:hypothetical protein
MKGMSMDNFSKQMEAYSIALYLKGFGYKTQVDTNTIVCYVQDPFGDTFNVMAVPTMEDARDFIDVRTKQ